MKSILVIVFIFLGFHVSAAKVCNKRALKRKDCLMALGKYRVHIWKDRIFVNNSIFRTHYDLHIKGENVEWSAARIFKKGKNSFFEMKLWDQPQKSGSIQELKWLVYKLKDIDLYKGDDLVLQKRAPKNEAGYLKEKASRHKLNYSKGVVQWQVGHLKGEHTFQKLMPLVKKELVEQKLEAERKAKEEEEAKKAEEANKKD